MENTIFEKLTQLRQQAPLVQNITNYVVMNNTANALLALGASPVMAHAQEEVEEIAAIAGALVVNIGTLSTAWVKGMLKASAYAHQHQKPWLLDPVGAGISKLRNQALTDLLENRPTVIRGNASEILALQNMTQSGVKGVDSTHQSEVAIAAARMLAKKYQCVVCISGEKDYVVSSRQTAEIANGDPMMQKVTGLGCSASAVIGAFIALGKDPFMETVAGTAIFSLAGELAAKQAQGPGTLQLHLYDQLYQLQKGTLDMHLKVKIHAEA